ncbi:zinc finger BED domain-containing protein 4-like [Hydra vulgaris]|uniref:Zinc finger BED domain-containing protein 4-like n=1 Tax=Hydra vulgaris TaxID=6087 RepID=A0ABM4CLK7_HYDVU
MSCCAAHNLNLAFEKALKFLSANLVFEMIKTSKEMVGYFKHSGKNQELNNTLKQNVATRWNCQFFLLQSLSYRLDHVKSILADSKQFDKLEQLNNVNKKLLHDVIEFLHTFYKVTVQLSHDNVPASPDVWPVLFCLRSVCKINGSDSDSVRDLKAAFLSSLNEKYIIHPLHKLSILIVPSYKYLSFVNTEDRNFVYLEMRSMVDKIISSSLNQVIRKDSGNTDIDSFSECSHSEQLPPSKKNQADPELYDLLADFKTAATPLSNANRNDTKHELDKYLALPLTACDPLQFWKDNDCEHKLPTMALIGRKLLAIPATSTASERVFSVCGVTVSECRARLNPETLERLIFLKYNM